MPIRGFTRFGPERVDRWAVCLEPGLLMGLDFDLDRIGELSIPFTSTVPVDGTLQADLVWVAPGEDPTWCTPFGFSERDQVVLASATESVSAGAGTGTTVTAQITPEPAADRIERADGADLVLMLTLTSAVPATGGAGGVDLMPGGSLELPLLEYHDVLPAVLPSANNTVEDDPEDVFVDDEPRKESPGVGLLAVLGLLALAGRVARKR